MQHIPALFSTAFAARLNQLCAMEVREAVDGEPLRPGVALIAPGNFHLVVRWRVDHYIAHVIDGPTIWHQQPAVDLLFKSAADAGAAPHCTAGILTGMGRDGAEGLLQLQQGGATTFAQDEATCVVFWVPCRRPPWESSGRRCSCRSTASPPTSLHRPPQASPVAPPPARPRRRPPFLMNPDHPPRPPAASPLSILIVDDEPVVLSALKETLERERLHVVVACAGPQALLLVVEEQDRSAIISTEKMREMPGLDFLIESRRLRPSTPRGSHHRGPLAADDRRRDQQGRNLPASSPSPAAAGGTDRRSPERLPSPP